MQSTAMKALAPFSGSAALQIVVDPTETFQRFDGVGAAITDTAAYGLTVNLTAAQRHALLTEMFGANGFQTVRISMGASDFQSVPYFTYDDSGSASLANFSVQPDASRVIPVLQEILAINPRLKVIASPWSPPAALKTNGALVGGNFNATAANLTTWANYFVKFIRAYASYGIPIWAVTTANEPGFSPTNYPGCLWAASDMATFIGSYLGPAFDAAGILARILVGDHHWDVTPAFAGVSLASSTANPYVDGVAYHGYSGTPIGQLGTARPYPTKTTHFTEMRSLVSQSYDTATAIMAGDLAVGSIRYGASTLTLWNLVFDENGGPAQASSGRRGVVTIKSDKSGTITRNPEFYMLTHLGRFVRPGAKRCASTTFAVGQGGADVETVAFVNLDGSVVVFLWNAAGVAKTVTIVDAVTGLGSPLSLPARAMATVTYGATSAVAPGALTPPGAPGITATAGSASITLAITAPTSAGDTQIGGYAVYRGTTASGEAAAPIAILPAGATSFIDTGLTNGTAYFYKVQAFGGGGTGPASAEATATPSATLQALTLAPTSATAGTAYTGTISGKTSGSTITASSSDGITLTVSGTSVTGTFSAAGSPTVTLTETLSGATNTPKTSAVSFTVAAAGSAPAALAQDAVATGNSNGAATSASWSHTAASGANLAIVALAMNVGSTGTSTDVPTASAVTFGGQAMTNLDRAITTGHFGFERLVEIWSLVNPPTGAQTVQVSTPQGAAGSAPSTFGTSVTYLNAIASGPLGTQAQAATTTSGNVSTLSVTTSAAKGVVLSVGAARSTATITAGSGQTILSTGLSGTNVEGIVTSQAAGGGVTSTVSISTGADRMALLSVPILSN